MSLTFKITRRKPLENATEELKRKLFDTRRQKSEPGVGRSGTRLDKVKANLEIKVREWK